MKTYETNNGNYDIYVDFDVEEGKTLSDYAYFQYSSELQRLSREDLTNGDIVLQRH